MPIDIKTPNSPGWHLNRLARKLADRTRRLDNLYSYHDGEPPLPQGAKNAREAYQDIQKMARLNLAEMIVRAPRYRMAVTSVRTAADSDETGDEMAWRLWRRAGLEVSSADVHRNMLIAGDAYVITGVVDDELAITAEDPRQVVTMHDPVRQSKVTSALKLFHDADSERDLAFLYLPGRVHVAYRARRSTIALTLRPRFSSGWEWDTERGGADGLELPGLPDVVPVTRFRNESGVSEFEHHTDLLDRINHMILQRMVIATLQAFKQRGIIVSSEDMPSTDPDTGETINYDEVFTADPGALWKLPETAKMWESGQVDLTPILSSVKADIQHLAAVTFTPLAMLSPEGQNQSAEGATFAREGLTSKVDDRKLRCTQAWSQVISYAFRCLGDQERASLDEISIGWMPSERYGLAERYDAAVKAKAAGVPWRTIMADVLQFTPEQIRRMEADRLNDELLFGAVAGVVTADAASTDPAVQAAKDESAAMKARYDALGVAIRAGVDPDDAARRLGLGGTKFTGAVPVSLRLPDSDAAGLEAKGATGKS